MKNHWTLVREMAEVERTQVFSGGACNIMDAEGQLRRNEERDPINEWLTEQGVWFFDPQIHPDTHGSEYDYAIHNPLEQRARAVAHINLYEVSPRTFGGITSLEIAADHFRWQEPMVIYYSDGDPSGDNIPAHSRRGHPLFVPTGITQNRDIMRAHYQEFIKNANNMRKYLMSFANEMDTLTVAFTDEPRPGDIVVTPYRMHASEVFRAVVDAASGRRVFVAVTGGNAAQDQRGHPRLIVPQEPPEIEMKALLDQYVDEGNQLRKAIAELIGISVFVRVVYTQRAAILALEEVLRLKGILQRPAQPLV